MFRFNGKTTREEAISEAELAFCTSFSDKWEIICILENEYSEYEQSCLIVYRDEYGNLMMNHCSICSCYGYDECWKPELTTQEMAAKYMDGYL